MKKSGRADIRIADGGTERWNRAPDESQSGGRATGWGRTMWVRRNARTQKGRPLLDLITMQNPWNVKPAHDGDRGGVEAQAESEERPPIGRADKDEGPRDPNVQTPEEEGERYEAMNAVPAKAASVGGRAAKPAKISKPECRR